MDDFKKQQYNQFCKAWQGRHCDCCCPDHKKWKKRDSRKARKVLKQELRREQEEEQTT